MSKSYENSKIVAFISKDLLRALNIWEDLGKYAKIKEEFIDFLLYCGIAKIFW